MKKEKNMSDKKDQKDIESQKEESTTEENSSNSFWKKLGSAVKKAVDCCLE